MKTDILKLIKQTKRTFYGSEEVAKEAPNSKGEKLKKDDIHFFKSDKYLTNQEVMDLYDKKGLEPITLEDLCLYDIEFGLDDSKYYATLWKDKDNNWCYATFDRWSDERRVIVYHYDCGWDDYWWFAGVRKDSSQSSDTQNSLELLTLELSEAIKVVKENGYKVIKEM